MTEGDEASPWAEIVGPCYTVASMVRALGRTEAEVMAAGNDLRLLMLHTDEDTYLFPAFPDPGWQGGRRADGSSPRSSDRGELTVGVGTVVECRVARR